MLQITLLRIALSRYLDGTTSNYGIYSLGVSSGANSNNTILNNSIVTPYHGIYLSGVSGFEAQNTNVNGNVLTGIRYYGIYAYYNQNAIIQYNQIGFYSGATTTFYGIYVGYSASTYNVHHNTISGGYTSSTVYGIQNYYSSSTFAYNTISNLYNTSSSGWYGLYDYYGGTSTWSNNTVQNITNTGTASFYGIYPYYATNSTWNNNTISNITITSGTMYAAYMYYTTTSLFRDNVINGLAGTGTIYGLYITGGTTNTVYNNKIYNLSYNGTSSGLVYGVYISSGTTNNIYNNMVYDLRAASTTGTAPQIRALAIAGGTTDNIWNNSVYMNTTGSNTAFATAALYVSSGTTIDLKNNIFVNKSVPGATGRSVAFWKTTAGYSTLSATSDKNIYYAGTPDATHLIAYISTTTPVSYPTLGEYKTANVGKDQGSYAEDVPFLNPASPYDLHINTTTPTRVEGNAIPIVPPVTIDIDNQPRHATLPDIGADEGTFTPISGPPSAPNLASPPNAATDVALAALLTWSAGSDGGTPTSYEVFFGTASNPPSVGTQTTTSYDPVLAYGTIYYWKIKAINGSGNATSVIYSFTTVADPTVSTFPWTVDFGTTGATFPPLNWSQLTGFIGDPLTPGGLWAQDDFGNVATTPPNYSARLNIWSTGYKYWLVTPPIAIPAGHELKFDLAYTTYSGTATPTPGGQADDKFVVLISSSPTMAGATVLREWNNTGSPYVYDTISNTGENHILNLNSYTGTKYIAFYGESTVSGGDNNVYVDNVIVRPVPAGPPSAPILVSPANAATNVALAALLTWTAGSTGGTPTSYEVYFGTASNPPSVGTQATLSYDPLLAYSTIYYWKIKAINGSGNATSGIYSFTTLADPTVTTFPLIESFEGTTFPPVNWTNAKTAGSGSPGIWDRQTTGTNPTCSPADGTAMARYNAYSLSSGTQGILVTPPLGFTSDQYEVRFMMYRDPGYPGYIEGVRVHYNTNNNLTGATLLGTINRDQAMAPVVTTTGWYEYAFNMPPGTTGTAYVILEAFSAFGNNIFIDNVRIIQLITNLNAPVVTITKVGADVHLSWGAVTNATHYVISSSDNPYTGFTPLATTTNLYYDVIAPAVAKKFYQVVANNNPILKALSELPLSLEEQIRKDALDSRGKF